MVLRMIIMILVPASSFAADVCNVCLDAPAPTSKLSTGKGGCQHDCVETLSKPKFTGELFYVVDDAEKQALPIGKGAFFTLPTKGKHALKIVGPSGKAWDKIPFDCSEYAHGSRIYFESHGFYGPGWKTAPLPKNISKCDWHPDHVQK